MTTKRLLNKPSGGKISAPTAEWFHACMRHCCDSSSVEDVRLLQLWLLQLLGCGSLHAPCDSCGSLSRAVAPTPWRSSSGCRHCNSSTVAGASLSPLRISPGRIRNQPCLRILRMGPPELTHHRGAIEFTFDTSTQPPSAAETETTCRFQALTNVRWTSWTKCGIQSREKNNMWPTTIRLKTRNRNLILMTNKHVHLHGSDMVEHVWAYGAVTKQKSKWGVEGNMVIHVSTSGLPCNMFSLSPHTMVNVHPRCCFPKQFLWDWRTRTWSSSVLLYLFHRFSEFSNEFSTVFAHMSPQFSTDVDFPPQLQPLDHFLL